MIRVRVHDVLKQKKQWVDSVRTPGVIAAPNPHKSDNEYGPYFWVYVKHGHARPAVNERVTWTLMRKQREERKDDDDDNDEDSNKEETDSVTLHGVVTRSLFVGHDAAGEVELRSIFIA